MSWASRPGATVTGRGPAKNYLTLPVTVDFFETLGAAAQRGRTFTAEDLHGGCALVVSDKFWRGPLAGDPSIIGQSLTLDQRACAVLGVMPPAFAFYPPETQIWTLLLPDDPRLQKYFGVFMVARLRSGITEAQARDELTALHTALNANASNGENGFTPLVSGLQDQFTWLAGRSLRTTLEIVFAYVVLVLWIACLNVANLLLGRSFARSREFAIRAALGAGSRRLIRQLLTEAGLLSAAGGALGLLVAYAAVRYFVHLEPIELPVGAHISLSLPALAFTAVLSIITAIVFAVIPAWTISRGDVQAGLRSTGPGAAPGRQRLSLLLVATEMALSVVLLAGAGLLMRSVLSFESAPLGFSPGNVIATNGSLPGERYRDPARRVAFYDELDRMLGELPGIESAVIASTLPPYGLGLNTLEVQGQPAARDSQVHDIGEATVGENYFRTLGVPLLRGRAFDAQDRPDSDQAAVVNEALVHEYFPGRDPLGLQIRLGGEKTWLTIVGVAGSERRLQLLNEMRWTEQPVVYRALDQSPPAFFSIAIKGAERQSGLRHAIEQSVSSIDGEAAIGEFEPLRSRLAASLKYPRFRAIVLVAFGAFAILIAAVGLYGVLAQFVAQRIREIGVRIAVGAETRNIFALIARQGGVPVVIGLIVGIALTLEITRYLGSFLYGVTPTDPVTFGSVTILMLAIASLAMILPAKRAARVDPMIALRND